MKKTYRCQMIFRLVIFRLVIFRLVIFRLERGANLKVRYYDTTRR